MSGLPIGFHSFNVCFPLRYLHYKVKCPKCWTIWIQTLNLQKKKKNFIALLFSLLLFFHLSSSSYLRFTDLFNTPITKLCAFHLSSWSLFKTIFWNKYHYIPFIGCKNWGIETLRNLSKFPELTNVSPGIFTLNYFTSIYHLHNTLQQATPQTF